MITFDTGSTSNSIDIYIQDATSTFGEGLTSLVYNSANLIAYYRVGSTGVPASITLADQTNTGSWVSGGFAEVEPTYMAGIYRFDIPDELCVSPDYVHIMFSGADDMVPSLLRFKCVASDGYVAGGVVEEITVLDDFAEPVDGVACWISVDEAGDQVVQGTNYTNTFGLVTFVLETGSYYLWRQRTGYNFVNPTSLEVT